MFVFAGSLFIDLYADDFSPSSNAWNNRASPAADVSADNGDFVLQSGAAPSLQRLGLANAVVFNATATGYSRLEANNGWFPAGMYGGSDWRVLENVHVFG